MEKEQPQPDDSAPDHTAATPKRQRSDSESSLSSRSIRSTRSLRSDDLEFVHENGRIYGNDSYYMPCDQAEQDRLALQHQVFVLALKGKLTTTISTPSMRRILDLGTGPGYWAAAMAHQYPHAEVVGVDMAVWDLETTESVSGGARVTWELDDLDVWGVEPDVDEITSRMAQYDPFRDHANRQPAESPTKSKSRPTESQSQSQIQLMPLTPAETSINPYESEPEEQPGWHFSEAFDLIHLRGMKGSFSYWEDVYAEIYRNLSPGGWVEIADYDIVIPDSLKKNNIPVDPMPTFRKLYVSMMQASFKSGRPLGTYYLHPTYLEEAGFKNVTTTYVNVPIGQWPEDEEQKKIGKLFLVVFMENSEATLLRLLTKYGDKERVWTAEEVMAAVEEAKREIFSWSDRAEKGEVEGWCASFKWVIGKKGRHS